jgi:hypothetical protein
VGRADGLLEKEEAEETEFELLDPMKRMWEGKFRLLE